MLNKCPRYNDPTKQQIKQPHSLYRENVTLRRYIYKNVYYQISFQPKEGAFYIWKLCWSLWKDNYFVEQVDDPAMYLSLYGVLWSLGIQYK
jgi:hypothetical protein